jgi:hypothetical protein
MIVTYQTDSLIGNSITFNDLDRGWIEYCNPYCSVFQSDGISQLLYQQFNQHACDLIAKYLFAQDKKHIGFISHLCQVLLHDEFILPIFGKISKNNQFEITAGTSRMIARITNGKSANEFKF